MTSIITLIGDYFEGRQRSAFMGYQAAFASTGGLVFISTGGFLADLHWRFPFLIYSVSLIILVMAVISIYEPSRVKPAGGVKFVSLELLKRTPPQAFWVYGIAFFSFAVFYMVPVQLPFMLSSIADVSNTQVGIAIAFMNITAITMAFSYSRIKKRLDFPYIMAMVYLLVACGYSIISFSTSYWMMVVGILTSGLGFGMQMANINLWLVNLAPAEIRGTLVGYLNTCIFFGMFMSPVLLQPLVGIADLHASFFLVAMLLVVLAGALLYTGKRGYWERPS